MARDISHRKAAEDALVKSEQLFRAILEEGPIGTALVDLTQRPIHANQALCRMLGYTVQELIRVSLPALADAAHADASQRLWSETIQGRRKGFHIVKPFLRKDGQRIWASLTASIIRDPSGRPLYGLELLENITDRLEAQEKLRQERDFATGLVETAQVIVLVLDTAGCVVRLNRFGQTLTGYTDQELRGISWLELMLPESDRAETSEFFRHILQAQGRQPYQHENRIRTRDGREPLIRWFSSLLRDAGAEVVGVLAIGHDITEMRQKEEQFRQAVKMEAIGRMAGGLAHDFNNILAIIQGYGELLGKSMQPGDPRLEDVGKIREASQRAARLIRQLLALGKRPAPSAGLGDWGRQAVQPELLSLNRIIVAMESILRRTLRQDVQLRAELADELWGVMADRSEVEQILLNLVTNAREAMPDGGCITIRTGNAALDEQAVPNKLPDQPASAAPADSALGGSANRQCVLLSVSDTGVGMDGPTQSKVFEPFFTTKADRGGTGLGLATCYGIVRQYGGHICFETAPGKGSTFYVYLPRARE